MNQRAIFLFFTLFLGGCALIVEVDLPEEQPKLVVNSLFHPDSVWRVSLRSSRDILDPDFQSLVIIPSAQIRILDEAGGEIGKLDHYGWYGFESESKIYPEPGREYSVEVVSEEFGVCIASSEVPSVIPITDFSFEPLPDRQGFFAGRLKFKGPSSEANFYEVQAMVEISLMNYPPTDPPTYQYRWTSTYVSVKDNSSLDINDDEKRFNDIKFNGREVTVPIEFGTGYGNVQRIRIILMHVSRDYFLYATTRDAQFNTGFDPFAQPVQVYNNIENGLGVFAGFSQSYVEVEIQE